MRLRSAACIAAAALILTACGGPDTATGVVIELEGDITSVDHFVLRLPDGSDHVVVPAPGITFHDTAPIGHLSDHLRSGAPVRIEYEQLDDGSWVALSVEDAGE